MWFKLACLAVVALAIANAAVSRDRNNKPYKVVCYLGSWANYRQGDGKFLIEHIDPFLCTHVVYGFAKLANDHIAAYDPYLDLKENWGLGAYQRFNNLKTINPHLTTILAIGGWNEGSTKYSQMAADPARRATFVDSCVKFLLKYDFDGLDMDWEYPANRGGVPEDKQNFIHLLKELKEAFTPHGLILTAAVSAGKATIDTAYDIRSMGIYLDIINLMAYDFHGSWETVTGHNAPLYDRPEESDFEKALNVDFSVKLWMKDAPAKKIVLGMGLYGRSFTLKSASETGIGAPTTGKGAAGPITREGGMLGYNEICLNLKQGWKTVFPDRIEAPYAYHDRQWVGYDDIKSIGIKVDYLRSKNLGGGMVWSVETDDFRGKCGDGKYPLLTAINEKLNGPVVRHTPPPDVTRPSGGPDPDVTEGPNVPEGTPIPDDGSYFNCQEDGYFRSPKDCTKFYHCSGYKYKLYQCGGDNVFDPDTKRCTSRDKAKAC